jgi:hypothetical protein
VTYEDEVTKISCAVMMHHTDIASMNEVEARSEVGKDTSGEAVTSKLHAPLLRAAHLDLVFEL